MIHKRVLVTGGAGLIGRHLVPLLVSKGYQVTVLDQYKYDYPSVKFVQADFSNDSIIVPLLKQSDVVIHLAAMIGVDNCRLNPKKVIEINNTNTKQFFDHCVANGVKKIIFSSSSEVYGDSKDVPFKEDGKLSPYSIYGKNKILIEKYLFNLQKKSEIKVGIVRFFNVYGPGQKETFVVPIFINNCLTNKPLIVHGDGEQIRCFTYVGDAAQGLLMLSEYNKTPFEIVNIGRSFEYTMLDLANAVIKANPSSTSTIRLVPYGQSGVRSASMEVARRVPYTNKAKKLLNFVATTSLEEGIVKTMEYYKT
jgi:UDP-glucose 4-epimerase